jgi:hypothetical protein
MAIPDVVGTPVALTNNATLAGEQPGSSPFRVIEKLFHRQHELFVSTVSSFRSMAYCKPGCSLMVSNVLLYVAV